MRRRPRMTKIPAPNCNPRLQLSPLRQRCKLLHQNHVTPVRRPNFERSRINSRKSKQQMCEPLRVDLFRRHLVALAVAHIPRLVVSDGAAARRAAVRGARGRSGDLAAAEAGLAGQSAALPVAVDAVRFGGLGVGRLAILMLSRGKRDRGEEMEFTYTTPAGCGAAQVQAATDLPTWTVLAAHGGLSFVKKRGYCRDVTPWLVGGYYGVGRLLVKVLMDREGSGLCLAEERR